MTCVLRGSLFAEQIYTQIYSIHVPECNVCGSQSMTDRFNMHLHVSLTVQYCESVVYALRKVDSVTKMYVFGRVFGSTLKWQQHRLIQSLVQICAAGMLSNWLTKYFQLKLDIIWHVHSCKCECIQNCHLKCTQHDLRGCKSKYAKSHSLSFICEGEKKKKT